MAAMINNPKDRRAFTRLPIDCRVTFKRPGDKDVAFGAGRNLSACGVQFVADRPLILGTELEVNIMPSSRLIAPLNAMVKVVRLEAGADADEFLVAGAIQEMIN